MRESKKRTLMDVTQQTRTGAGEAIAYCSFCRERVCVGVGEYMSNDTIAVVTPVAVLS